MGARSLVRMLAKAAGPAAASALLLLGAAVAGAQQPRDSSRTAADTAAAPASGTGPVGPRRESRWQPYRPELLPRAEERARAVDGGMQTIRISTLALILIGVIVILLIAR